MPRVIASRRKLPLRPPERVVSAWSLVALPAVIATMCWFFHFTVPAVVLTAFAAMMVFAMIGGGSECERQRRLAVERTGESTCSFARSFDFRRTDTAVMRAVYEELQANVLFPIRATDHLRDNLHLDDEDLGLDIVPAITRRVGRTLDGYEANPYYAQSTTVAGLVHFISAQPRDHTEQT